MKDVEKDVVLEEKDNNKIVLKCMENICSYYNVGREEIMNYFRMLNRHK